MIGLMVVALLAVACGDGPAAPPVGDIEEVCIDDFCASYPAGWVVADQSDQFVSFTHSESEELIATVGRVNLEGIAVNAGAVWPVPPREVVDLLWSLLDGGDAELSTVTLIEGGSLDSRGFVSTGRLWHRLVPITASRGLGIEVRAPNSSWQEHADVFRKGVAVLNEDL